jgi:hypothetical protein
LAGNILAFESYRRCGFSNLRFLIELQCLSLNFQPVMRFDLHVPVELEQAVFLIVNRSIGNYLIRFVTRGREHLQIHVLEFMVAVGIGHVAIGPQPQIQPIVFRQPLFVAVDDAGNLFREFRAFRHHPKDYVVAHLVIRHADKDRPGHQQDQRQGTRNGGHASAQVNRGDSFFSGYGLHYFFRFQISDF